MAVREFYKPDEAGPRKPESLPYHARVEVAVSTGAQCAGQATDISMSSVSLYINEPLRLRDMVQLQLPLLSTGQTLSVTATVEQMAGSTYDFHFLWLSPQDHQALANFLRRLVLQAGPPRPFVGLKKGDSRSALPMTTHLVRHKPTIASLWNTAMTFLKTSR
jgi:hypothetical protein